MARNIQETNRSLYIVANVSSLENRCIKLSVQYANELKLYSSNPTSECFKKKLHYNVDDTMKSFDIRMKMTFNNYDINLHDIAPLLLLCELYVLSPCQVLRTDLSSFCEPFACCLDPVVVWVSVVYHQCLFL